MKNRIVFFFCVMLSAPLSAQPVGFEQSIQQAIERDIWSLQSEQQQQALLNQSQSIPKLPNPKISVNLMNMPVDSWQFNQEPMSQIVLGVSQAIPRGDTRQIEQNLLSQEATAQPVLRQLRKASLRQKIGLLWLDIFLAQANIKIIRANENLFEQMAEIATAHYSSATGNTQQQDVIRAQLEWTQLQDSQFQYEQQRQSAVAELAAWLEQPQLSRVGAELPVVDNTARQFIHSINDKQSYLIQRLMLHPQLQSLDIEQKLSEQKIHLNKQAYRPQWQVNASLAHRADSPNGMSRSDFVSFGVSVDLPILNQGSIEHKIKASVYQAEAIKTKKRLLIKQMQGQIHAQLNMLAQLKQRQRLYRSSLLAQFEEQAETALSAYTNDTGDFAEVVRSRVAQLNSQIQALKIDIEILKIWLNLEFYLAPVQQNFISGQEA